MALLKLGGSAVFICGILFVAMGTTYTPIQDDDKKPAEASDVTKSDEHADSVANKFQPVDNMHHFMEYVCEPSYKGLKALLATKPADRKAWKAFKNHSLVLAETSAIVSSRAPEENKIQWQQISHAVYESGKSLYKSTGKYEEAKKHWGVMIDKCNQCHTVFAEGKHQLKK